MKAYQKAFLYWLYELDPESGRRVVRQALLGLPKGGGKTPIASAVGSLELAGPVIFAGWNADGSPRGRARQAPVVPVGAASFEQADLVFGDMKVNWRESARLAPAAEVYDTEILLKDRPGKAFRVAAARGTNDGLRPTCYICDEVHELVDTQKEGAHLVIANGCAKREDSLQLNTTTAGHDLDTLLGRLYQRGQKIAAGKEADPSFLMVWYEAGDQWNLEDPDQLEQAIREAYPPDADYVNLGDIRRRYGEIPEFEFRRYFLNQWTRADESWLPPGAWQACVGDAQIPDGSRVWVGVDVALYHDSTAVVTVWPRPDGKTAVQAQVWTPDGDKLDVGDVMQHIRDVADRLDVAAVAYDPRFFDVPAGMLMDEGVPMLEVPQSPERMVPACGHAWEQIVAGQVVHDGDPVLEDHVLSAARRQSERGWSLSKGKSRRKIDACIAMVLALHMAAQQDGAAAIPMIW